MQSVGCRRTQNVVLSPFLFKVLKWQFPEENLEGSLIPLQGTTGDCTIKHFTAVSNYAL
jgi:hypothetical protein